MPEPATGNWPANVSAVIITKEEKAAQLAQAPPGGQSVVQSVQHHPNGAPYADISVRNVVPNVLTTPKPAGTKMPENQPNLESKTEIVEDAEVFYGKQALILAKQIDVPVVWKTADRSPIDIATATKMLSEHGERSICFDFELLATLPEEEISDEDPYMAIPPNPIASQPVSSPILPPAAIQVPPGFPRPDQSSANLVPQQGIAQDQPIDPITDRERLAFGNVLTTPGQTVYVRPNVIRVEVEGNVKVQKGRTGNVRMMRITRLDPVSGNMHLANAVRTNVQPPNVQAPNPAVTYRTSQAAAAQAVADRIAVPRPQVPVPTVNQGRADQIDEFEF